MSQRLDDRVERFANAVANLLARRRGLVAELAAALAHPRQQLALARERLEGPASRLAALFEKPPLWIDGARAVKTLERLLESTSYGNVLQRGFAVVRGPEGVITRAGQVIAGLALDIEFGDGRAAAVGAGPGMSGARKPKAKRGKPPPGGDPQGSLL
jgi:exodeoxyribonuclease VII large subunit